MNVGHVDVAAALSQQATENGSAEIGWSVRGLRILAAVYNNDGQMLYFAALITCPAIWRRSDIVSAVSCLERRRRMVSCVRSISPSATAAITFRAESSIVDIALSA